MGLTNLLDLGTGTYDVAGGNSPHQGGLYAGGSNYRPFGHETVGRGLAAKVVPLDATGAPSASGVVGLALLGFSISKKISAQLIPLMNADPAKWSKLYPIDCNVPGRDAIDLADPNNAYWTTEVPTAMLNSGVDPNQVQVGWLMSGTQYATGYAWPANVTYIKGLLVSCVQNAKAFFPNLKLLYITLPHYEGYKQAPPAIEPETYQSAWAFKELIADQIAGSAALNFASPANPILAPWLSWGGYIWTDGSTPRSWDGLTLDCPADVIPDGVHPSVTGSTKFAKYLLNEWKRDATARPWYTGIPNPKAGSPTGPGMTGSLGG